MTPDAAAEVVVEDVDVVPVPVEVDDEVPEVTPDVVEIPEPVLVDEPVNDVRGEVVAPEIVEVDIAEDEPVIELVELVPTMGMEDDTVARDEAVLL